MSCLLLNNVGTQLFQLICLLVLKLIVHFLTKAVTPDYLKGTDSKLTVKGKVDIMIKEGFDLKKSELENSQKIIKGPYKYLSKINNFMSLEALCNFLMAI